MTHKQRINYLRIAMGLAGTPINEPTAELITRLVNGIDEKGGKFSLNDVVGIEMDVRRKYSKKTKRNNKKGE